MAQDQNQDNLQPETPEAEAAQKPVVPEVERRKQVRYFPKEANLTYKKGGFMGFLGGRSSPDFAQPIIDISKSGINFATNEKIYPGTKVKMRIHLSKDAPAFDVDGKVVWTGKGRGDYEFCAGVQFTKYGQDAWKYLSNIRKYIKERSIGSTTGFFKPGQGKAQG